MFKTEKVFLSKEKEQEIVEKLKEKRIQSIRKEEVERDSKELDKLLENLALIIEDEILYSITKVDYIPPKAKKAVINIFPRGKHTYYKEKKGKNKNLLSLGIKITFDENVSYRYNTEIVVDSRATIIDNKVIRIGMIRKNIFNYLMKADGCYSSMEIIVEF